MRDTQTRPLIISLPVVFALLLQGLVSATARSDVEQPLPKPSGDVLLTIKGALRHGNGEARADFDRAMLEQLGLQEVRTSTPWTDGTPVFRGVLLRDLIDRVGATGRTARAVALNDYAFDIPTADFYSYPVILAFEMNGRPLTVREKGPLWIVYPLDDFDELNDRATKRKMVWQLTEIELR